MHLKARKEGLFVVPSRAGMVFRRRNLFAEVYLEDPGTGQSVLRPVKLLSLELTAGRIHHQEGGVPPSRNDILEIDPHRPGFFRIVKGLGYAGVVESGHPKGLTRAVTEFWEAS